MKSSRTRGVPSTRGVPFDWKLPAGIVFVTTLVVAVLDRRTLSGLIVIPLLTVVALPVVAKLAQAEKRFDLLGLMLFSLATHFALSILRFRGAADARSYHTVGVEFAASFRDFQFAIDPTGRVPGTGSVRYLSGLAHVLTFDDFYATLLVFTFAAFWGTWFFYRAFTIAMPNGAHYRYAKLIFLWPSMLFWPSSLGKEACMAFTVGLASLGFAMLITHRWVGVAPMALGVLGVTMIRPHVALTFIVAMLVSLLVPRSAEGRSIQSGPRVAVLLLVLVAGSILARTTVEFLDLENLNSESVEFAFDRTEQRTDQGGSNFRAARVQSPLDYPWSMVTVLFRPFPIEAKSLEALVASLEGMVLIGFVMLFVRQIAAIPQLLRSHSYFAFSVSYVLVFCFVFSVIGNFGILARQRTQVLPFMFVILAAGAAGSARHSRRSTSRRVLKHGAPSMASRRLAVSRRSMVSER